MTSNQPTKWTARMKGYAEFLITMCIAIGLVLGAVRWATGDSLTSKLRDAMGVTALTDSVSELASTVRANTAAIERITPSPPVAEYDTIRSLVLSPCVLGAGCEYQIRARRTTFGAACDAPITVSRIVTDSGGLTHPVEAAGYASPQRLSNSWALINAAFMTPTSANLGTADFKMRLGYSCGDRYIEESTPPLVFRIVE